MGTRTVNSLAICLRWCKSSSTQELTDPWGWYNQSVLKKCMIWRNKESIFSDILSPFVSACSDVSNDLDLWSISIRRKNKINNPFFLWKKERLSIDLAITTGLLVIRVTVTIVHIYVDMYISISFVSLLQHGDYKWFEWNQMRNNKGCTPHFPGIVVQSVRAPPCQGGSCGFEPRQSRPRIRWIDQFISRFSVKRGDKEQDLIPSRRILLSFRIYHRTNKVKECKWQ